MGSSLYVVLAIVLGLVVGAGFTWLWQVADRRRRRARAALSPRVPEGVEILFDALESIVIVSDRSHNVIQSSPGAAAKGLVVKGDRLNDRVAAVADEARRSGAVVSTDLELPRGPFGRAELHFRVRVAPLAPQFLLILAEDRTEALRVEAVRRDFVANVSHELKTPIGAVTLLAEAMDEAADDPEQVRYFAGRLTIEGRRLAQLTHELIELSRLQSGDTMENAEVVRLHRVLEQAVDRSRVAAEAKDITLTLAEPLSSAEGGDIHVYADQALLLMGFHNLVANAVQYSPEHSTVGVTARRVDGNVEVAITDQGIGIAREDQDRIFERFYRVDPARSRKTGGTGLGLSIVKHVVENHGGDIRIWSEIGRGSTFTVRLPEVELPRRSPSRAR